MEEILLSTSFTSAGQQQSRLGGRERLNTTQMRETQTGGGVAGRCNSHWAANDEGSSRSWLVEGERKRTSGNGLGLRHSVTESESESGPFPFASIQSSPICSSSVINRFRNDLILSSRRISSWIVSILNPKTIHETELGQLCSLGLAWRGLPLQVLPQYEISRSSSTYFDGWYLADNRFQSSVLEIFCSVL